jgi:hypothetical protein
MRNNARSGKTKAGYSKNHAFAPSGKKKEVPVFDQLPFAN